jgi:hypothetical protein
MAEPPEADERPDDRRLIPGGSFDAARVPIGMNAVDPDVMPSGGRADLVRGNAEEESGTRPAGPDDRPTMPRPGAEPVG